VLALSNAALGPFMPDLTFIFDVDPETGLSRAAQRRGQGVADTFEEKDLAFHRAVREGFRRIATAEPLRCQLIDAARSVNEIANEIALAVQSALPAANEAIG
jgi:dTMP kinase